MNSSPCLANDSCYCNFECRSPLARIGNHMPGPQPQPFPVWLQLLQQRLRCLCAETLFLLPPMLLLTAPSHIPQHSPG